MKSFLFSCVLVLFFSCSNNDIIKEDTPPKNTDPTFSKVLIQPIIIKNKDKKPAFYKLNKSIINKAYSKAKVEFIFLSPKYYDSDAMYNGEITDLGAMVNELTSNKILVGERDVVNLIVSKKLVGREAPLGKGLTPGNITFIALLEDETRIENSFNVSHEVGHNFGLKHAVDDANVKNNLPNIMGDGPFEDRLNPDNSLNDYQINIVNNAKITHTSEKANELIQLYGLSIEN